MRNVGTASEVVEAFLDASLYPNRTPSAPVPGGCRVSVEREAGRLWLRSYRTTVAVRLATRDAVAVTPRRYSVTTSKLMGRLVRGLAAQGYQPSGEVIEVAANVPGRWGGFGPAWHATGVESLPFVVWALPCWCDGPTTDADGEGGERLEHAHGAPGCRTTYTR